MKLQIFKAWPPVLALLLATTQTPAQPVQPPQPELELPSVYRVEVIVFRHADGQSDARAADEPVNFAGLNDPRDSLRAFQTAQHALTMVNEALPRLSPPELDESTPWLENDRERLQPIPPMYIETDALSSEMRNALKRLESSSLTEPLAVRSWLQQAERGRTSPRLRIHDAMQVAVQSPSSQPARPLFWPAWPAARALVRDGYPAALGRLFAADPPLQMLYRTDGSLRLMRRQFLHFEIDLVWQEHIDMTPELFQPAELARPDWLNRPADVPHQIEDSPSSWRIHRIRQSRVIRPGRLEYFDSTLLGVLVWLERFEQVVPEIEPPEELNPAPAGSQQATPEDVR